MENNLLTKEEYNYLRTIDTLNQAIDTLKKTNKELNDKFLNLSTEYADYRSNAERNYKSLESRHIAGLTSSAKECEELRVRLENAEKKLKAVNITENTVTETLKLQLNELNKKNEYLSRLLENKDITISNIKNKMKEIEDYSNELEESIEQYEKETKTLQIRLKNRCEDFDSLNNILTQELQEKEKTISEMKKNKKQPTTDSQIEELVKKHGNRVPEKELALIEGVTFDNGGIVKLAKGGVLTLKKNFLSPTYSKVEKQE